MTRIFWIHGCGIAWVNDLSQARAGRMWMQHYFHRDADEWHINHTFSYNIN